jgi:transglutaminase-like putative cysteine protease
MMNHRLTAAAALATVSASLSLFAVLHGASWLGEGFAAVVLIALAGTLTRAATVPAAIGATIAVLIASIPLMAGTGWLGVIGALVLAGITALSLTGNRSARGFAMLVTYCSFLLIYLNAVFAGAQSYARLIPSPASMKAIWQLPSQASAQFQASPPIPATKPVDLVAVAGIGAIAIIVDYMAVRIRRPALAGLPLLLLFCVPVASNLKGFGFGQSVSFALATAGYLTLLSTDGRQRLRMWGRLVTVRRVTGADDGGGPDTRDLAATGRRVGLAAICLAIVIPVALPTSKPHDIFSKGGGGSGGGTGGSGYSDDTSPLGIIQRDLAESKPLPVLSYTSSAANPDQVYLGQWVMNYDQGSQSWQIDGSGSLAEITGTKMPYGVPGLQAGTATSMVETTLNIGSQLAGTPVPLPYPPVRITDTNAAQKLSEWSGSLMVFDGQQQRNLRLTVTSEVPSVNASILNTDYEAVPTSIQDAYGSYRGPDASQLRAIAVQHTSGAITPFEIAYDLQNWLRSSAFTYTLRPNLPATSGWLLQFLDQGRRGYCQQFAEAFADLARTLNIPTRIVVGYTAGKQGANGTWQVTTADAHAWPEVFFPGYGWERFEPTPGGSAGQGTAEAPAYTNNFSGNPSTTGPGSNSSAPPSTSPGKTPAGSNLKACRVLHVQITCKDTSTGGQLALNPAASHGFPVGIPVAIVVVLLLASPAIGRWTTRRRRWMVASSDAQLALAAWRELQDDLTDYGVSTLPSDSPRMTVIRVADAARLRPAPRQALARIALAVERARYSLGAQPGARLRTDVATVRKALATNASKLQRLRALLLPPSTLAAASNALQSAGRATSWIDWSWPTMRQQFRRIVLHRAS